jgi:DNA repair protein RecN (Recombination protein N)
VVQINGTTTTLAVLKELGELWIDFHGPGEPQKLFKEAVQLELIDSYALAKAPDDSIKRVFEQYEKDFAAWSALLKQIDSLKGESQLSEEEQEFIRSQLRKMEQLDLDPEAIESLERDYQRASSSQALKEVTSALFEGLTGDQGVSERLADLIRFGDELADLDSEGKGIQERLQSLMIEIADLSESLRDLAETTDFEEETIELLESRMETWMGLKRKYGGSIETVTEQKTQFEEKLALQGDLSGTLSRLENEKKALEQQLNQSADSLAEFRKNAGETLAGNVQSLLGSLGFKNARLKIEVERLEKLNATGSSRCSIRFSPNAGQSLQPLNKIASSGETARVMLALKTILADVDHTPVLVFDEVDANVGGEIGKEVGREMRRLGDMHQVLCVTHLPQVASQGHRHFVVEKNQDEASTRVSIRPIHGKEADRIGEIARMLGDRKSKSALEHAESLLNLA